jgi:hypothetical protein
VIAEAAVYDELVQLISTMLSFVNVGDPLEKATMMGPVVSEAAADRIIAMIERARQHSRLVAGGERLAGDHAAGHFIPPTVFVDVDTDLEIAPAGGLRPSRSCGAPIPPTGCAWPTRRLTGSRDICGLETLERRTG